MLAGLFHIVPRAGPFKALAFRADAGNRKVVHGQIQRVDRAYRELLAGVGSGRLNLPNDNLDMGEATKAGEYKLADGAYAKLLNKLEGDYADMPRDLRNDILAFYQDLGLPIATKTNESEWTRLQDELNRLTAVDRDLRRELQRGSATSSAGCQMTDGSSLAAQVRWWALAYLFAAVAAAPAQGGKFSWPIPAFTAGLARRPAMKSSQARGRE